MLSVLLQLKDLICENMKYPNQAKIVGKGSTSFIKRTITV